MSSPPSAYTIDQLAPNQQQTTAGSLDSTPLWASNAPTPAIASTSDRSTEEPCLEEPQAAAGTREDGEPPCPIISNDIEDLKREIDLDDPASIRRLDALSQWERYLYAIHHLEKVPLDDFINQDSIKLYCESVERFQRLSVHCAKSVTQAGIILARSARIRTHSRSGSYFLLLWAYHMKVFPILYSGESIQAPNPNWRKLRDELALVVLRGAALPRFDTDTQAINSESMERIVQKEARWMVTPEEW